MPDILFQDHRKWFVWALFAAAFIRLATLGAYPLTDNTEARYAEVAREMLVSGDWITPHLHGIKFWSKPPLSIWLTAGALSLFGFNEFGARLSPFLLSLLVAWLVYSLAVRQRGPDYALAAVVVLVSSVLFFVSSGAVMTDAALCFGTTLAMVGFWRALAGTRSRIWGYLFFIGLAIGLLAKGPVGVVLTFCPIVLWTLWKNRWGDVGSRIPWISGLLLTATLTLPWYLAAEARTPGFLDYFIIGEHWKRFIQPGWAGDLYGSAHSQPRGMIWLVWIIAAFPWSLLFLRSRVEDYVRHRRMLFFFCKADDWTAYILLWAVAPMIFFTLAGNILWTYVLPGLPGFALLMAQELLPGLRSNEWEGSVSQSWAMVKSTAGLVTPIIFAFLIILWSFVPVKNSQKYLLSQYLELRPNGASKLVYLYDRPYSAEFYSSGAAIRATQPDQFESFRTDAAPDFFAIKREHLMDLDEKFKKNLVRLGSYDDFILLRESKVVRGAALTLSYP